MTTLSDDALEFAKDHISKFYDSDFFPKPREFEALWHNWEEVKNELKSKNIQKFHVSPPRTFAAPKPSGDFRVVHQLEPVDALIYVAMGYLVAESLEKARAPKKSRIACSYRFEIKDGNFFSGGTGYRDFFERTEELAEDFEYIFATDITDFYNQIYLHRLNNAIEHADSSKKALGDDIEKFITNMNAKASQGIPVGPASSIVMAEAVLMDVDGFLANQDVQHTRYVDDFRIFSDSRDKLIRIQQRLTLYLYEQHRLTLSTAKSTIEKSSKFVKDRLHNPYAEEKLELFRSIEVFNPYTEELEVLDFEVEDQTELLKARLEHILDRVLDRDQLDLGLARTAIRNAKRHQIEDIAVPILEEIEFFSPVINDVMLYLDEITDNDFVESHGEIIEALLDSSVVEIEIVRFWIEWYFTRHPQLLRRPYIREFVKDSPYFVNRARQAVAEKDVAWVRENKQRLFEIGNWERRALLDAARILSSDERNHWLKLTETSAPVAIDRWVAKWVRETSG